jgi:hypothetical protein
MLLGSETLITVSILVVYCVGAVATFQALNIWTLTDLCISPLKFISNYSQSSHTSLLPSRLNLQSKHTKSSFCSTPIQVDLVSDSDR